MRCPGCGKENPAAVKCCNACGAAMSARCANCDFENPPQFRFCGQCGTRLPGPAAEPAPFERHRPREPERRQITVMFCDLVGSTALSTRLDPEELREVVRHYQTLCAEIVSRHEGHIAQYLGDGIMAYFGYPVAHEDDACRAVRAGLEIVTAMQSLSARGNESLAVRVSLHTGLVVIGEMGVGDKRELLALGTAPNIAARLQALAAPNTVVISSATHHLVQGFFTLQSQGTHLLKGLNAPLAVYRVLYESGVHTRLEAAMKSGLTPLVGKDRELQELLTAWQRVTAGEPQAVLVNGEAGIGKSRLLLALKQSLAGTPHVWLEAQGSPYYQNSALHPLIEVLQRLLDFCRDDTAERKITKLEDWLRQQEQPVAEALPLFATLLAVPLADDYVAPNLNPQRLKQKTLEAWQAILLHMAQQQPVVFAVEDLHWADPSTLTMLDSMLHLPAPARLLLLLTSRPEFVPGWNGHARVTQINLNRLTQEQIETMVAQVTGDKTLPAPVLKQIVTKTDGIPLFVEELTRMVLESGLLREEDRRFELIGPLPPLAIPATLQDWLMARLDRLAPVKEVAQLAAAIGREFSYDLINAVDLVEERTLRQGLAQLASAGLLQSQSDAGSRSVTYAFKHALIQEAAYQSLLKSRRQQYHQRIAQTLVEKFYDTACEQPELLAHHYTEAGLYDTAIAYWQWAGEKAIQRSAHPEAISHLSKGLELLQHLPENAQHDQLEVELLTYLGVAMTASQGYTSPEVDKIYSRARTLCERLNQTPRLASAMLGLWKAALVRGDLRQAHALAQECMLLAETKQDLELLLTAHLTLGVSAASTGELLTAREHLREAIHLYLPSDHHTDIYDYGEDLGVVALIYLAHVSWMLGYPEQALKYSEEALQLAQKLAHPFTLAIALHFTAGTHELRRERHLMHARAEALIALAEEQGFPFWRACGEIQKGILLFDQGRQQEAIGMIDRAIASLQAGGAQIGEAGGKAQRALAYGKTGRVPEGLALIEEALALTRTGRECQDEAEQWRIKGELYRMHTAREPEENERQAEACFQQALEIARKQQAKSWELRAAMSLSRLWQKQGRSGAAHDLLAGIYGWFTEGFDTADLQEAKALLAELADTG
ncbi:MAG: AAA family ATPase [candidate division KSB1 bacterium]|nr:AAA family ATPase [candidate division KSB1 bacterium]MDZ7274794.1 AAA family ATPase [candidate division KSB1 bacterium]MDZ7285619.1 AAA family ATPase [candidate division KSB1 bacterium]MDZ7298651.1 AAA family ATPase [candidate division KSB1 bacterium]MDZ7307491.1 AAA family ATPase [candidate division KSB1 bacterium]